jgi:hypothetical protein
MAKALFGHVGLAPDLRTVAELRRLRQQVRDLEAELVRLREVNESLATRTTVADELISLAVNEQALSEPALT